MLHNRCGANDHIGLYSASQTRTLGWSNSWAISARKGFIEEFPHANETRQKAPHKRH